MLNLFILFLRKKNPSQSFIWYLINIIKNKDSQHLLFFIIQKCRHVYIERAIWISSRLVEDRAKVAEENPLGALEIQFFNGDA